MKIITGHLGTEHIYAIDAASYQAALLGIGEFVLTRGSRFAYEVISNNRIDVKDGDVLCQGYHARTPPGSTDQLLIEDGVSGKMRHDIIAVRFEKISTGTDSDGAGLVVIQGTPGVVGVDPVLITGNLLGADKVHEMPLYRVIIDGLNIAGVVPLFEVLPVMRRISSGTCWPEDAQNGDIFFARFLTRRDNSRFFIVRPSVSQNRLCMVHGTKTVLKIYPEGG